jgi:hypothetical protein
MRAWDGAIRFDVGADVDFVGHKCDSFRYWLKRRIRIMSSTTIAIGIGTTIRVFIIMIIIISSMIVVSAAAGLENPCSGSLYDVKSVTYGTT